jgi:hypothetical protein
LWFTRKVLNMATQIDFERARLLLDVLHKSINVPEAMPLASAARMELVALLRPGASPNASAGASASPSPNIVTPSQPTVADRRI